MQNTKPKQDRLGALISELATVTNAAKMPAGLYANKSDLQAAEARIKQLEQENLALRTRPLAITPAPAKPPTTAQDWQPKPKPTISKAGFDKLTPTERMEFIKQGGKISN